MSRSNKQHEQMERLKSKAEMDKEKLNESKYRSMFGEILQEHRDTIKTFFAEHIEDQNYSAESKLLKKAVTAEANAMIGGALMGFVAFLSIRYLPYTAVRFIGGEKKVQKMIEKDAKMKRSNSLWMKQAAGNMLSFLFESSIGIWAGIRGYEMAAKLQSEEVCEDITKIPLSEGKSIVSDTLCNEWVNLAHKRIPRSFWKNLDNNNTGGLSDEKTWEYALEFADNCVKRKRYEEILRHDKKLKETDEIIIPHPGVRELTKEEAENLVQSQQ